jgi:hypothetical protein
MIALRQLPGLIDIFIDDYATIIFSSLPSSAAFSRHFRDATLRQPLRHAVACCFRHASAAAAMIRRQPLSRHCAA